MKKLIVIADWVSDSLICQEVRTVVGGFLKASSEAIITFIDSTPSTIHAAFLASQIVEIEERFGKPLETVIFQYIDPRFHSDYALKDIEGAKRLIIRLKSGLYLTGPNTGYNFSLVKDRIEEIFEYKGLNVEEQLHYLEFYARISAHLMDGMEDEMDLEEISSNIIPSLQGFYISHVDNFGSIKTLIPQSYLKGKFEFGDLISITINNITKKAKYIPRLFGDQAGEFVIYPGSSGRNNDRYLEIAAWRNFTETEPTSAAQQFNDPKPGMEVKIL